MYLYIYILYILKEFNFFKQRRKKIGEKEEGKKVVKSIRGLTPNAWL